MASSTTGEFRRRAHVILTASSDAEVERALDIDPVLSSLDFQREYWLSLKLRRGQPDGSPGQRRAAERFFAILHRRLHRRLLESYVPPVASATATDPGRSTDLFEFLPEYLRIVLRSMGTRIPAPVLRPFLPGRDDAAVALAISPVDESVLPVYAKAAGVGWSLVVVTCAHCGEKRLVPHAHRVDCALDGTLLEPALRGAFEMPSCARCATAACAPDFVWLRDDESLSDELNGVSSVWRLRDDAFVYRPPPGSHKNEASNAPLFRYRASLLIDELAFAIDARQIRTLVIAVQCAAAETVEFLQQLTSDRNDEIPLLGRILIEDLAHKLEAGDISPTQVEDILEQSAPQFFMKAPVAIGTEALRSRPYYRLVVNLAAEATANINNHPDLDRAILAGQTAQCFLALEEPALAQAAFVRAEELASRVTEPEWAAVLTQDLLVTRGELYVALGDHERAVEIREALSKQIEQTAAMSTFDRVRAHQLGASLALSLYRTNRIGEAFEVFARETSALGGLVDTMSNSPDELVQGHARLAKLSLSGALANWGSLLVDVADVLELAEEVAPVLQLSSEEGEGRGADILARLSDKLRLRIRQLGAVLRPVSEALPVIHKYFPGSAQNAIAPVSAWRAAAREMFERALQMSISVEGWNFAARQSLKLARELDRLGQRGDAETALRQTIEFASRVGDHEQLTRANAALAGRALGAGDGVGALEYLRAAARELLREIIGLGHDARDDEMPEAVAGLALRCVPQGAQPLDSVIVAESLKAISITASLSRGCGAPGHQVAAPPGTALQQLELSREKLLLQLSRRSSRMRNDPAIVQRLRDLEASIGIARKEACLRDPQYRRWCDATALDLPDPATIDEHLRSIGPRTTYLGWFYSQDRIWAYGAWPGGGLAIPARCPRALLDQLPRAVEASDVTDDFRRVWAETLLAPFESRLSELGPDDTVVVSLDESMRDIPIATLPFDGRYLCEMVRVCHTPSIGVFQSCIRRMNNYQLDSALCIGDPRRRGYDALPAAAREAQTIARLFAAEGRRSQVLLGRAATAKALSEASRSADCIHFACHADGSPYPHLVLTPTEEDHGNLDEARILRELRLKEGCFVNLDACASGKHGDAHGPVTLGLVPSFLVAGAAAVGAAFWPVRDAQSARFSEEFFRRLLSSNAPVASLADTQRACVSGELGPRMKQIDAWGAFAIFGAP